MVIICDPRINRITVGFVELGGLIHGLGGLIRFTDRKEQSCSGWSVIGVRAPFAKAQVWIDHRREGGKSLMRGRILPCYILIVS